MSYDIWRPWLRRHDEYDTIWNWSCLVRHQEKRLVCEIHSLGGYFMLNFAIKVNFVKIVLLQAVVSFL
jgi:hypothetical protein